jgi:hypothetical protein
MRILFVLALIVGGFLGYYRAQFERDHAQLVSTVSRYLDNSKEFLKIEPRSTDWPAPLSGADIDADLIKNFAEGSAERGHKLSYKQYRVVKLMIVPRLKELMARTIDKCHAQGMSDKETAVMLEIEGEQQVKYYAEGIAAILSYSDDTDL